MYIKRACRHHPWTRLAASLRAVSIIIWAVPMPVCFEMSEARECLKTAYDMLHSHKVLTGVSDSCVPGKTVKKLCIRLQGNWEIDARTVQEVLIQIQESENSAMESESALRYNELKDRMENGDRKGYEEGMRTYLKDLTRNSYHKNTGY